MVGGRDRHRRRDARRRGRRRRHAADARAPRDPAAPRDRARLRRPDEDRPRRRPPRRTSPRRTSATSCAARSSRARRSSGARTRRARASTSCAPRSSARCGRSRPREIGAAFRMPIQRSFTAKGHGTVVTGIPLSGRVRPGDELEILPAGLPVRVRGLQVHHRPAEEGGEGHRVAVNLTDVGWKDVHRGDVLATPGLFAATSGVEVALPAAALREGRPRIPRRHPLPRRLRRGPRPPRPHRSRASWRPARRALAQVRLDEPVVVAPGRPLPDPPGLGGAHARRRRRPRRLAVPREAGQGMGRGQPRRRRRRASATSRATSRRRCAARASIRSRSSALPQLVHDDRGGSALTRSRGLVAKGVLVELDSAPRGPARGSREGRRRRGREGAARPPREGSLRVRVHGARGRERDPPREGRDRALRRARRSTAGTLEKQQDQYRAKAFKGGLSQEDRRLIGWVEEKLRSTGHGVAFGRRDGDRAGQAREARS